MTSLGAAYIVSTSDKHVVARHSAPTPSNHTGVADAAASLPLALTQAIRKAILWAPEAAKIVVKSDSSEAVRILQQLRGIGPQLRSWQLPVPYQDLVEAVLAELDCRAAHSCDVQPRFIRSRRDRAEIKLART